MNLEWIVAVTRPRDVACHPNFPGDGAGSPAAYVAALVYGGEWTPRSDELRDSVAFDGAVALVDALLRRGTQRQALDELEKLLAIEASDLARHAALALMCSAAAAELDDQTRALRVLERSLKLVEAFPGPDSQLIQALLVQQKALRLRDSAIPHESACLAVLELVEQLNSGNCSTFRLSEAVGWESNRSVALVVETLRDAALSLLDRYDGERYKSPRIPTWQTQLREPPLETLLSIESRWASVYSNALADPSLFGRNKHAISLFASSRADVGYFATLNLELLGHGNVYRSRQRLALLRTMDSPADAANVTDALRLLRLAANRNDHHALSERTRLHGPLESLAADARTVLSSRADVSRLRVVEHRALADAADLLSRQEAEQGLDLALAAMESAGPPELPGSWEARGSKAEVVLLAIVRLASPAGRTTQVGSRLLELVTRSNAQDELMERAFASALEAFDWDAAGDDVKAAWTTWLQTNRARRPVLASPLSVALRSYPEATDAGSTDIVTQVNAVLSATTVVDSDLEELKAQLAQSLEAQRTDASHGTFSMAVYSPIELAAALVEFPGAASLWPQLIAALIDPALPRMAKERGLDRLASRGVKVPSGHHLELLPAADALMNAPDPFALFARGELTPYPAALRFLGVCLPTPDATLLSAIARLAGQGQLGRIEASKTVAVLAQARREPWMFVLAIEFSHDSEPEVVAHSSQALTFFAAEAGELAGTATQRVSELLQSDGILIPSLVLRRLSASGSSLPPSLAETVWRLGLQHPAKSIRAAARSVQPSPPELGD